MKNKMSEIKDLRNHALFVMDLEFLGADCRIWEVGIVLMQQNKIKDQFSAIVDPYPGFHTIPLAPDGYFSPTRAFLDSKGARSFDQVLRALVRWIRARTSKTCTPIFISHGAFRSDKPVFVKHATDVGFRIPQNWHWADTLVMCREQMPQRTEFTLASLVRDYLGDNTQTHRALDDAMQLARLIENKHITVDGFAYPSYALPLQSITGIGPKTEKKLHAAGVVSAAHLKECIMHIARQYPYDSNASFMWLTRIIGRDSTNIVNNLLVVC